MHSFFDDWRDISLEEMSFPIAKNFATFVVAHGAGAATFLCTKKGEKGTETVFLEVATSRPTRPEYPIHRTEIVGVAFFSNDTSPHVIVDRTDFPDTPHQNWTPEGCPFSICIDDRPWREAKLTYTPAELLQRIVAWFSKTCKGELHGENQPLDPYFMSSKYTFILPRDIFRLSDGEKIEIIASTQTGKENIILTKVIPWSDIHNFKEPGLTFAFICHEVKPDKMQRMRQAPNNLFSLHEMMLIRGVNLIESLKSQIQTWIIDDSQWKAIRINFSLAILVKLPIIHPKTGKIGAMSMFAFVSEETLGEIGIKLGLLSKSENKGFPFVTNIIPSEINIEALKDVTLDFSGVSENFDTNLAKRMSGCAEKPLLKAIVVGAGAVGSLVTTILTREGHFTWTIVDPDVLLPHNLARHSLLADSVGKHKATNLAEQLKNITTDCSAKSIVADVISPYENAETLSKALKEADVIFDSSASVAVSRHINDFECFARRTAFFFNPTGTAAVLLIEDEERNVDLRTLEAYFYSFLIQNFEYSDLLLSKPTRIPYSGNCSSLTNVIPTARIQILSALIAQGISEMQDSNSPCLQVWKIRPDSSIISSHLTPEQVIYYQLEDWCIRIQPNVIKEMFTIRDCKLPNETGGAILGVVDIPKKRIEVLGILPAPADSKESPCEFTRGIFGLAEMVKYSMEITADHIRYVGEWHSHPRGASANPSRTDISQLAILSSTLSTDSCPGVQIIVSDIGIRVVLGIAESDASNAIGRPQ